MKKIRLKARVVPQPCMFRDTCSGACEWCETHSYSEACVPFLQKEVESKSYMLRKWQEALETIKNRWIAAEKECRRLREQQKGDA